MEKQYWIQEQAPNGGYVNSVGLDPSTTFEEAQKQVEGWAKTFPSRRVRLALIITVPLN